MKLIHTKFDFHPAIYEYGFDKEFPYLSKQRVFHPAMTMVLISFWYEKSFILL